MQTESLENRREAQELLEANLRASLTFRVLSKLPNYIHIFIYVQSMNQLFYSTDETECAWKKRFITIVLGLLGCIEVDH